LIFEVVVPKEKGKPMLDSIAGGGRYDKLCGVGCVGFSLGNFLRKSLSKTA
jgi:histidyl-tRNA synthetase